MRSEENFKNVKVKMAPIKQEQITKLEQEFFMESKGETINM